MFTVYFNSDDFILMWSFPVYCHNLAETAFVEGSCSYCEGMTMSTLRLLLSFLMKARVTSDVTELAISAQSRARVWLTLWVTVGAFPPGQSLQTIELPSDGRGPSHGGSSMSFGSPGEDQRSIAALESWLMLNLIQS